MALLNANLSQHEEQIGFEALPAGWYEAKVIDSEIKDGSKGPYINWTWQVIGKPNKIWDVMSLGNDIAMQRLKTMAVCCRHKNPNFIQDTEELHGAVCRIRLKVDVDESGQYEPKNKITAFKPFEAAQPVQEFKQAAGAEHNPGPPPAQTAATSKPKMPWE